MKLLFFKPRIPEPDIFFFHKKSGWRRIESKERFVSALHVLCTPARLFLVIGARLIVES